MKTIAFAALLALTLTGCHGPGGPVERTGRAVDTAVYNVGTGVKRTGQSIQNAAN